jgi:hypothetical protein
VWQAINTDYLTGKSLAKELAPFQNADGKYWDSKLSQSTRSLGYIYPDIDENSAEETKKNFARLESWSIDKNGEFPVAPHPERTPLDLSDSPIFQGTAYKAPNAPHKPQALHAQVVAQAPILMAAAPTVEETATNPATESWYIDLKVER